MLRVVFNIAVDVVIGCVPFVGDAFDLFWRSNRRNLELLQRYSHDPLRRPDAVDYLLVGLGFALVAAAISTAADPRGLAAAADLASDLSQSESFPLAPQ